uniref:Uncharacterized protein n=1 Tax=Arion vulgaris TaxID=1028688 RepID=A0A0B6Z6U5_9EUPU
MFSYRVVILEKNPVFVLNSSTQWVIYSQHQVLIYSTQLLVEHRDSTVVCNFFPVFGCFLYGFAGLSSLLQFLKKTLSKMSASCQLSLFASFSLVSD